MSRDSVNNKLQYLVGRWRDAQQRQREMMFAREFNVNTVQSAISDVSTAEATLALFIAGRVRDGYLLTLPSAADETTWDMIDAPTEPVWIEDVRQALRGNGR